MPLPGRPVHPLDSQPSRRSAPHHFARLHAAPAGRFTRWITALSPFSLAAVGEASCRAWPAALAAGFRPTRSRASRSFASLRAAPGRRFTRWITALSPFSLAAVCEASCRAWPAASAAGCRPTRSRASRRFARLRAVRGAASAAGRANANRPGTSRCAGPDLPPISRGASHATAATRWGWAIEPGPAAAGTISIARSASAQMVSEGFTPGLADTADPSTTYRPG